MFFSIICILVSICFCVVAMKGKQIELSHKTKKITDAINNVLLVSPMIAAVVFSVLFCTVLKGQLIGRSSHALIVFALWVYGTAFYVNIVKYFKNKIFIFICFTGMIASIVTAIILTPLDRYLESKGQNYRNTPFLQVYGRGGKPCPNCGAALCRMTVGGRSSVYCMVCQCPTTK